MARPFSEVTHTWVNPRKLKVVANGFW